MKCKSCGNEIMNYDQVCPYCGKPVQQENVYSYGSNPYQQQNNGTSNPYGAQYSQNSYSQGYEVPINNGSKSKMVLIITGIITLLIILACLLTAFIRNTMDKVQEEQSIAESQEAEKESRPDRMLDSNTEYTPVTEDAAVDDMVLLGVKAGFGFNEISNALRERYPELTFRMDEESEDPETDWITDTVYFSTNGDQKISLYGITDKAVYVVGLDSDSKACFAQLYFGDIFGKSTDGEPGIYCGNTFNKNQKMFSQLKASLDQQFGEGKRFDIGDEEITSCYRYRLDSDTMLYLKFRKSDSQEGSVKLHDTILEFYRNTES